LRRGQQPGGVFPQENGQRRYARGTNAASLFAIALEGGVRREAAPAYFAREAQLIEIFGLIVGHAARQDFRFPGRSAELAAFKLLDDLQRAIEAVQLVAGRNVLPAVEEGEEFRSGDGLDLAPQPADGETVNTGQQA